MKLGAIYFGASATSLEFFGSDHRPIELTLSPKLDYLVPNSRLRNSQFKFETYWMVEKGFEQIVEEGWWMTPTEGKLHDRIRRCGSFLKEWAGDNFRKLSKRISKQWKKLNSLKTHDMWQNSITLIEEFEGDIEKMVMQKEDFWKQQSGNLWLERGDSNTKYFHAQASARRAKNHISGLVSSHGDFCSDWQGMREIIADYFENLFQSSNPSDEELKTVLDNILPKKDRSVESPSKWIPPPWGKLRMDVDACVNEARGSFGIGGVVRDSQGKLMMAFGKRIDHPISVLEAELRAICEGLERAQLNGFFPQLVASDSLLSVQAVADPEDERLCSKMGGNVSKNATEVLCWDALYRVSDTFEGGQYRKTDLPTMFSIGSGPLLKA
ncbi:hypothetical protein DH2020_047396 [Rehmannia glutinosa]|uniref:RNase H type-1 domain-containing protein n=1 Tax=Rehmannia glutinosa TaxID=99300 RepID=A0ABR0U8P2_REHGL